MTFAERIAMNRKQMNKKLGGLPPVVVLAAAAVVHSRLDLICASYILTPLHFAMFVHHTIISCTAAHRYSIFVSTYKLKLLPIPSPLRVSCCIYIYSNPPEARCFLQLRSRYQPHISFK